MPVRRSDSLPRYDWARTRRIEGRSESVTDVVGQVNSQEGIACHDAAMANRRWWSAAVDV